MKTATKEINKSKIKLERKISKNIKNDPKAFYKYTRSKIKTKETVGPLHDEHDNPITDKIKQQKFSISFVQ